MAIDPDILAAFSDLSGLSETDRRMMAATLTENRFRAGAQLCAEGDASDACWFLVEGEVEAAKSDPDGPVQLSEARRDEPEVLEHDFDFRTIWPEHEGDADRGLNPY